MAENSPLLPVPGPPGQWLLGHLPQLGRDSLATFSDLSREWGDVARVKMLGLGKIGARFDLNVLSHPEDIAYVLDRQGDNYPGAGFLRQRYITLFGPCILAAEGSDWARRRKLEAPAFSRSRLNAIADVIGLETAVTVAQWEKRCEQGQPFDVVPGLMELTLRVAGRMMLGTDFGAAISSLEEDSRTLFRDMNPAFIQANTPVLKLFSSAPRRRFAKARARIDAVMLELVTRRRRDLAAGIESDDLLDVLMGARDAEGIGWTDSEIASEIHCVARAGQDTTGSSLAWGLFVLARHPEVEARLLAELAEVVGDRPPVAADLPQLPYLRAVYDETLRLYPPIPLLARAAEKADTIRGHHIPKAGFVILMPWLTHRDPRWWPEPEKFNPERFLNPNWKQERPKYAYFPFGGSARFCIGAGLALLQGPLILATLAQKFRIKVAAEVTATPRAAITILPHGGLPVTLQKR